MSAVPPLEPAPIAPAPAPAAPTSTSIAPARMRELEAEATYAHERLTLARRRAMLGRGRPNRLAELERIADGADRRLRAAKHQ